MNIVYLIGNGFDINQGLDTSANSLIRSYLEDVEKRVRAGNDVSWGVKYLAKNISSNIVTWANYEKEIGVISKGFEEHFGTADAYIDACRDFASFLAEKLREEDEKGKLISFDNSRFSSFSNECPKCFRDGLVPRDRNKVSGLVFSPEAITVNFISFNYTSLLDRFLQEFSAAAFIDKDVIREGRRYSVRYNSPIHVHGFLWDDDGIIVGVDSAEQIESPTFQRESSLLNKIVKPIVNERMGSLREEDAADAIERADIICIYGMSLGETDRVWWSKVLERVAQSGTLLIINELLVKGSPIPWDRPEMRERVISRFMEVANDGTIASEELELCQDKIFVAANTKTFDLVG